ncbi:DUF4307 domain-containing protein [Streptomyces lavendulae]|uniref:Uncharacterized protein n=1 Tax=Streptomyces lavendulae subsp. lavendulae TaxID=58340 RepID=A0A2K8PEA1_STRLA|nr:DUF4307 domain-containing protein [Streptomyces lavendulae]GLX39363.1 membrane protein [Streptomyces roseochromogenus]ATZ24808.1 hypothetical protein SLAV_14770 [Streptomyces lavendulae subsp. lavendulae]QUQ54639.1 hypothetical protein SLLC_12835 [Streptomyces lavendulae subsp. lavendulae]GLV80615.1 membrane protein [Streptomyces lavendulae subsp. lavendulae]GLV98883.1 membrane protein [Streptomyces lavendulae subsp. lavendulae]
MSAVREGLPEGRYGRSADERADRKLKVVGSVLGVGLLAVVGWIGWDYVGGQAVSAEVIKFQIVSDSEVKVHLEVRKDASVTGVCTLSSQDKEHGEVGRADFTFAQRAGRVDEMVTLKTTGRATMIELVGCQATASAG